MGFAVDGRSACNQSPEGGVSVCLSAVDEVDGAMEICVSVQKQCGRIVWRLEEVTKMTEVNVAGQSAGPHVRDGL
jgi:hypothetical protein